jgi:hypothetical protein
VVARVGAPKDRTERRRSKPAAHNGISALAEVLTWRRVTYPPVPFASAALVPGLTFVAQQARRVAAAPS